MEITRIAGMVIQNEKLLMLVPKGYPSLWTLGGRLEPGESEEECLKREVMEELGVQLIACKFFKEYKTPAFYGPEDNTTQKIYIIEIEGKIKPQSEIEGFVWYTKEDFYNKRYLMIPVTEEKIIPDLIKEGIW